MLSYYDYFLASGTAGWLSSGYSTRCPHYLTQRCRDSDGFYDESNLGHQDTDAFHVFQPYRCIYLALGWGASHLPFGWLGRILSRFGAVSVWCLAWSDSIHGVRADEEIWLREA